MEAIAIVIGTWVITTVLTSSDGPYGSLYKLREIKAVKDFGLLECHMCTAFWVALVLSLCFGQPIMILIAWGVSVLVDNLLNIFLSR